MAASSTSSLPRDLKAALSALAARWLEGQQFNLQIQMLLTLALHEHPKFESTFGDLLERKEVPTSQDPILAWLLALTGNRQAFEELDVSPFLKTEPVFRNADGDRVPMRWRPGTETLFELFMSYATLPELNEAVFFLCPSYYDGPTYRGLESAVEYDNLELLEFLAIDYERNGELLEHSTQLEVIWQDEPPVEDYEEDQNYSYYFSAIRLALRELNGPALRIMKRAYRDSEWIDLSSFVDTELPFNPHLMDLLLELAPMSAIKMLVMPRFRYTENQALYVITRLTPEMMKMSPNHRVVIGVLLSLIAQGYYRAAVELASRFPNLELDLRYYKSSVSVTPYKFNIRTVIPMMREAGLEEVALALQRLL